MESVRQQFSAEISMCPVHVENPVSVSSLTRKLQPNWWFNLIWRLHWLFHYGHQWNSTLKGCISKATPPAWLWGSWAEVTPCQGWGAGQITVGTHVNRKDFPLTWSTQNMLWNSSTPLKASMSQIRKCGRYTTVLISTCLVYALLLEVISVCRPLLSTQCWETLFWKTAPGERDWGARGGFRSLCKASPSGR